MSVEESKTKSPALWVPSLYVAEGLPFVATMLVGWQGAFWNLAKILAMGPVLGLAYVLEKNTGVKPAWMTVMGLFGGLLVIFSLYHSRMLPSGKRAEGVRSVKAGLREFAHVA